MPKKSTPARSGVPRNRPKAQKNFELVRQTSSVVDEMVAPPETVTDAESIAAVSTAQLETATRSPRTTKTKKAETPVTGTSTMVEPEVVEKSSSGEIGSSTNTATDTIAPRGSASARLAARRQSVQRVQQRAASLITAEHFSYVRRDLAFIAILASIMFLIIIALHFVPGIGS
ncbi:MAG: hypothetical protein M3Z24_09535 [Chloroflexota bacterium]|nr:hypothetical protein [Chloroflexota bacterium]